MLISVYPMGYSYVLAERDLMRPKTKSISHVLSNQEDISAISARMKRANGQMAAVIRMLDEGKNCEEIVTQMAAVSKAINTAAFVLISSSLKECLVENKGNSDQVSEKLQKLFLSLA
jgi:DNA-binding FrmR family transcriptional regulator